MYWNTVNPLLQKVLEETMSADIFAPFCLVGGTSLSLQIGHRMSADIDLFTDAEYGSIDFPAINQFFRDQYPYVDTNAGQEIGLGTSYYVGQSEAEAIKVDIYYIDNFIRPITDQDNIRLASIEDIIAMKLDIIGRGGRKKDFWDLHALQEDYPISHMINLYLERYPYGHSEEDIREGLTSFMIADDDFDPICLLGKHWELIKLDFVQWVSGNAAQ
jgi:hypothetical protein